MRGRTSWRADARSWIWGAAGHRVKWWSWWGGEPKWRADGVPASPAPYHPFAREISFRGVSFLRSAVRGIYVSVRLGDFRPEQSGRSGHGGFPGMRTSRHLPGACRDRWHATTIVPPSMHRSAIKLPRDRGHSLCSSGSALLHPENITSHRNPATKPYDRTKERLTQDDVEKIGPR